MKKIHWNSDCARTIEELEKKYRNATSSLTSEIDLVRSHNILLTKENSELKERIVSLCEQYRFTATMEDNAVNMFNQLSPMYDNLVIENAALKKDIESLRSTPLGLKVPPEMPKKPGRKKKE